MVTQKQPRRTPGTRKAGIPTPSNSKRTAKTGATAAGGISSEAVSKKTGKSWEEWFHVLDRVGADQWDHKRIAQYLREKLGVGNWWNQMVAVGYEQARGLRKPNETVRGWQVSVSKTVLIPVSVLYKAFADKTVRAAWLGGAPLTVRKATKNKSLRVAYTADTTLEANFYAKGDAKSMVSVQQSKLKNAAAVDKARAHWKKALNRLARYLNTV